MVACDYADDTFNFVFLCVHSRPTQTNEHERAAEMSGKAAARTEPQNRSEPNDCCGSNATERVLCVRVKRMAAGCARAFRSGCHHGAATATAAAACLCYRKRRRRLCAFKRLRMRVLWTGGFGAASSSHRPLWELVVRTAVHKRKWVTRFL